MHKLFTVIEHLVKTTGSWRIYLMIVYPNSWRKEEFNANKKIPIIHCVFLV